MMRATISYQRGDTLALVTIAGGYLSSQLWRGRRGGKAIVQVADERGGPVIRSWQGSHVYTIDIEEIPS